MGKILQNTNTYAGNIYDTQPAGQIIETAGDKTPAGYLPCDGRSVLRSEYPELFKKIGTKYGAVDEEHFNLPKEEDLISGSGGVTILKDDYDALSDEEKDSDISYYIPDSEGVDIEVINDEQVSEATTWSSEKISEILGNVRYTKVTVQVTTKGNTYIPLTDLGIHPSSMGNALIIGCMAKYNTGESYYQQFSNPTLEFLINQEYLRIILTDSSSSNVYVNTPLTFLICWW